MELDPQIFRYVKWAYGDVTPIMMAMVDGTTEVIPSQEGIRQGDALSVKLMGAVMHCALKELIDKVPGLDMDIFVDNITLSVQRGAEIIQEGPYAGMHKLDAALQVIGGEEWRKRGLILGEHQRYTAKQLQEGQNAVRILGGYFGSLEACEEAICDKVGEKLYLNNRIFGLDGSHLQLVTLRTSCLPQLSFQLRTTPEAQVKKAAKMVDEWATKALEAIMQVQRGAVRDHPTARSISQLPIRMGGVGLTSQVELAPYAYAASVGLAKVFRIKTASQRQYENPGAGVDDAALVQEMRQRGVQEAEQLTQALEMTMDEYWDGEGTKMYKGIQRKVMGIIGKKKWNEIFYALPTRELQARLVDSASKIGRAWQQVVPYDGFSTLSDESVKLNLRLRLNAGMEKHKSPHLVNGLCKCIRSRDNPQPKVAHNYTCQLSSTIRTARHYTIRNVLYRAAIKANMAPELEPTVQLEDEVTRRADIGLMDGLTIGTLYLDVVVVAPIKASTSTAPLTRAQINEQAAKMKKAAVRRQKKSEEKKRTPLTSMDDGGQRSGAGDNDGNAILFTSMNDGGQRSGVGDNDSTAMEKEAAAGLSREMDEELKDNQEGENEISPRDLMDEDGQNSPLEAFKALNHPERKAAERLLITHELRRAEKEKMRKYGCLITDSVGFMPVSFSTFGSTTPRVAKLLKGIAKRQKIREVWDNLGRTTNLNPMATALQYSYANLSLLFARYHTKFIPWGHKNPDYVELGFEENEEENYEDDFQE